MIPSSEKTNMYINSKFKDYYDFMLSTGQDEKIVWNRNPQVVELLDEDEKDILNEIDRYLGRFTSVVSYKLSGDGTVELTSPVYQVFVLAGELFIVDPTGKLVEDEPAAIKDIHDRTPKRYRYYPWLRTSAERPSKEDLITLCRSLNSPLITRNTPKLRNRRDWVINFSMKDRGLNVIDPHIVYALLMSYFQSEDPEMVEIDDEYKALAHGMDKTSFRRDTGGPTRKRKKINGK